MNRPVAIVEAALLQAQRTNQAIISAIPDLLMRIDRDGRCTGFSTGSTKKVLNANRLEIGASIFDLMPYDKAAERMTYVHRALESGQLQIYEYELEIEGQIHYEEARLIPLNQNEVLVIMRDRNQQKRVEAALGRSEADNQALMDAIPDLLIRVSRDGTYLDIQGRHRFSLYQGDQFGVNTTVYDSLPFAEAQRRMKYIQKTLETGLMQVYEQQLNIDGQLQYEEVRMVVTGRDEVLMIIRNITEQKRAEIALRIAEDNYRSIFENAVEGIFQSSPAGYFINVNPALAKIYGYDSPGAMIQSITNISEQLYVDAERRAEFITAIERYGTVKDFEYRCYCKDGSIIWNQVDARVVRDGSGEVLYYEGIVQDITERKRREDKLRQHLKELQIEIDQQKRAEEVATLTTSSYFQEVQQEVSAINLDEFWG